MVRKVTEWLLSEKEMEKISYSEIKALRKFLSLHAVPSTNFPEAVIITSTNCIERVKILRLPLLNRELMNSNNDKSHLVSLHCHIMLPKVIYQNLVKFVAAY